jgi:polyhydroxyalkanoate synthesis regulator phasin
MSQPPDRRRRAATRVPFAPFDRARQLAAEVVAQGQRARDQLGAVIDQLVEMGRQRNEEVGRIIRSGTDRRLSGIGLATKTDLAALERRLRALPAAKNAPATKQAAAKRKAVRKPGTTSSAKRTRSTARGSSR